MKTKLQIMLGLLFIAITISLVAVSVGWYSVYVEGDISLSNTSVSITTTGADFYGGAADLNYDGCLTKNGDTYTKAPYTPYRGEDGINDLYILLLSSNSLIDSNLGSGYVDTCTITKPEFDMFGYNKSTTPFTVVLLDKVDENTYKVADPTAGQYQYFAIIFGNGTDIFPYSNRDYMGTSFTLNIKFADC